jgi:hypothetical protein
MCKLFYNLPTVKLSGMISNQNQWTYASMLIRSLAETGYFATDANAHRMAALYKNFANWSETNYHIYGEYALDEEQYASILKCADNDHQEPTEDIMLLLVDNGLINFIVANCGDLQYAVRNLN